MLIGGRPVRAYPYTCRHCAVEWKEFQSYGNDMCATVSECKVCEKARLIDEEYGSYDELIAFMEGPEVLQKVLEFRACRDSNADAEERFWEAHFKEMRNAPVEGLEIAKSD